MTHSYRRLGNCLYVADSYFYNLENVEGQVGLAHDKYAMHGSQARSKLGWCLTWLPFLY